MTEKSLNERRVSALIKCAKTGLRESHFDRRLPMRVPGIDPGTALNTIDYLSSLFIDLLLKKDHEFLTDKNGVNWVSLNCPEFSEILTLL